MLIRKAKIFFITFFLWVTIGAAPTEIRGVYTSNTSNTFFETPNPQTLYQAKKVIKLMGTRFELVALHEDESKAWYAIEAGIKEIKRIEAMISSWDAQSYTSKINRAAGKNPVKVPTLLFGLVERAIKVSQLTDGAFDISFEGINPIWKFNQVYDHLPDSTTVKASVALVGYEEIILDRSQRTIMLNKSGMKIGFGAIGKGLAANAAKKIMMEEYGIKNGLVNAAGDLFAWGVDRTNASWTIGIADPFNKDQLIGSLRVEDTAVVTSGDYEKYIEIDGQRYSHIINPKTGWPARGLRSVTIVCKDAELADALATSVFVLGKEKGLSLINQLKFIECLMITDEGKVIKSEGINLLTQ